MSRSVELARVYVTLEATTVGLERGLSQAEKSLGRTAQFVIDHPIAAFTALGTAAIAVGLKLANMAAEVDQAFGLIAASIPEATSRLGDLRKEASTLSVGFGVSQKQIADGMLALARTGISSVDDLIAANRAAVEAARATGTDFGTVVSLLDSALDSFGLSAKDSEAILAKLFVTSQGKTSFAELAPIFEAVGKAAVKGGVDWTTLTEAAVTLKTEGLKTKQIITALSKGLDEEGAPAIRALAAASHVASDGMNEMREQTERMNNTLPNIQAQLREKLNAELLDIGRTALPLVIQGLQAVQAILATFAGGNKKLLDEAAIGTLTSTLGVLAKFPAGSNAAKQALDDLGDALSRVASIDVSRTSDQQLKVLQQGLTAAFRSGQLAGTALDKVGASLQQVNAEIRKRGAKPLVPPVDPKVGEDLRGVTAGLLATGKAGKKSGEDTVAAMTALRASVVLAFGELKAHVVESDRDLTELKDPTNALEQAIKKIGDGWVYVDGKWIVAERDMGEGAPKIRKGVSEIAFEAAHAADAFLFMADSLGLADEKMTALVSGIADIAEGISRLAKDPLGGLAQGIGGIAKAIGGLFGESVSERHLREALDRNRETLEELSRNIGDLNINLTGTQIAGTQGALQEFFDAGGALSKGWGDRLGAALLKRGLTIQDLDEVAKTLQIELRPNGHLAPDALRQLMEALGLIEPTQFAEDFRGQLEKLRHETELFNLTPAQQAARLAAIGAGETKGGASGALGGLDFATKAGRDAALATIQDLFTNFAKVPTSELGGLQPAEFLQLLEDLKSLIDTLNENAAAAAEEAAQKQTDAAGNAVEQAQKVVDVLKSQLDDALAAAAAAKGTAEATAANALAGKLQVQFEQAQATLAAAQAALLQAKEHPGEGVPGGPTTNPDPNAPPVPVDPVPDPIFTPDLQARNWENLLGFQRQISEGVEGILESIRGLAPIEAPPLPAGVLGGSASLGSSVSSSVRVDAVHINISGSGNPATDGAAAGQAFIDQIETELGRRLQAQQTGPWT